MIPTTLGEIAEITGGILHGNDVLITGPVVTDSREAESGSLYIARQGENADGHDFVDAAQRRGAVGAIGSRNMPNIPTVVVADVQTAFADLAHMLLNKLPALTTIGITGSSGKTTTKDLLASVLSAVAPTIAPYGSLNSEVGVPLTVARITPDTRYLVVEMGADGPGHIAYLTEIAPPQIGVVLNVGRAHLRAFGSAAATAKTKAEMVQSLSADGVAILNADDNLVMQMAPMCIGRVVTCGVHSDADVRASDIQVDAEGKASFTAHTAEGSVRIRLQILGAHQVNNALAVLAVATELGIPLARSAALISAGQVSSRHRLELHTLPTGTRIINDAYNANPDSMFAALKTLATMSSPHRVAVIGGMLDLGEQSADLHYAAGVQAGKLGLEEVVAVGDLAASAAAGAATYLPAEKVHCVQDLQSAAALIRQIVHPTSIVLLKSSRDSQLRLLGEDLVTQAAQEQENA